ncbi:MAG: hypothetical protein HQL38_06835 [Alphaproteobacteria bacterium]|nr:hypothetical protein [Alphaproteobacteria bacterium]MBF0392380.1 hypothetical protein [Alphaproteobacteria bacterium]
MPLKKFEREVLFFLLRHLLAGVAAALTFGGGLLWLDIANLRTLALQSGQPVLVLGLLFFGLIITFGSVAMGVGVMSLGEDGN